MARSFSVFISLFLFWLLLSGHFTVFLLLAGFVSAGAITLFAHRMDILDHESHPINLDWLALMIYWLWLVREIIKSGWDVTCRVLDPRLPISPTLVRFRPLQHSDIGLVIHANSITLTPGTISVEVEREGFLVHALTREGATGLAGSEMDRRVARLERNA